MTADTLQKALMLACRRIADGPQEYHEANTPEGWFEVFTDAAAKGMTTDEVLASYPPATYSNPLPSDPRVVHREELPTIRVSEGQPCPPFLLHQFSATSKPISNIQSDCSSAP